METYSELIKKAKSFYRGYGVAVRKHAEREAVASLTMPDFAYIQSERGDKDIENNSALATVGDAVLGAYTMLRAFPLDRSMTDDELSDLKVAVLSNDFLNTMGEKIAPYLNRYNNDFKSVEKGMATAFEAVVGFVALHAPAALGKFLRRFAFDAAVDSVVLKFTPLR